MGAIGHSEVWKRGTCETDETLLQIFFVVAIGLFLALSPQAHAGQGLALTKRVQDGLIAAEPVRGPGVDRELFNGKPVLVVFFSSW